MPTALSAPPAGHPEVGSPVPGGKDGSPDDDSGNFDNMLRHAQFQRFLLGKMASDKAKGKLKGEAEIAAYKDKKQKKKDDR